MNILQHLKINNPSATISGAQFNSLIDQISSELNFTGSSLIAAHPGGGHLNAPRLMSNYNSVSPVYSNGDSVKLPDAVAGYSMTVKNNGDHNLNVYPYETDAIDNLDVNVPVVLLPGEVRIFNALSSSLWESTNLKGLPGESGIVVPSVSAYSLGNNTSYAMITSGAITISNATTYVDGDLGESTLTGGSNIVYTGTGRDWGTSSTTASLNLYNQLIGLTASVTYGAVDISGVFIPGVYSYPSGITSAANTSITLLKDGDYVFQSGAAMSLGANFEVKLSKGAHSARVWFVSVGAVTSGANDIINGTILSNAAINIGSTNTIDGRLICVAGSAITVDGTDTVISIPA